MAGHNYYWITLLHHMIATHIFLCSQDELQRARHFLQSMGYKVRSEVRDVPISLSYQEAKEYSKIFKSFDKVC